MYSGSYKNQNFRLEKRLECFPDFNRITMRKFYNPSGGEKKKKTIYTDEGFPRWVNLDTGEIDFKDTEAILKSLKSSIARAKKKFRNLLYANKFDWFGVLTFDPAKVDSFNLDTCYKHIDLFRRKLAEVYPNCFMLLVPEMHKSGRYHFHILLSKIDEEAIGMHKNGKVCCHYLPKGCCSKEYYLKHYQNAKNKTPTDGAECYSLDSFKFGFTSFTKIININKARSYLMKYMSKAFGQIGKNRKKFVHTKNMNVPIEMRVDIMDISMDGIKENAYRELEESKISKKANEELEEHYYNEKWDMIEFYDYNPKMKEKTLMEFALNAFESTIEEFQRNIEDNYHLQKSGCFIYGNKRYNFIIINGRIEVVGDNFFNFASSISRAQGKINAMQSSCRGKRVIQLELGDLAHA